MCSASKKIKVCPKSVLTSIFRKSSSDFWKGKTLENVEFSRVFDWLREKDFFVSRRHSRLALLRCPKSLCGLERRAILTAAPFPPSLYRPQDALGGNAPCYSPSFVGLITEGPVRVFRLKRVKNERVRWTRSFFTGCGRRT